jgi:hypothetical protein
MPASPHIRPSEDKDADRAVWAAPER